MVYAFSIDGLPCQKAKKPCPNVSQQFLTSRQPWRVVCPYCLFAISSIQTFALWD